MTTSNATNITLAENLASARKGATFTGLITRKRGVDRGPKGAKVTYGDDLVHALIVTGFSYENLVSRSLDGLANLTVSDILTEAADKGLVAWEGRGKNATSRSLNAADVAVAIQELRDSFEKTLNGTNTSTTDHVFDTLEVDGEKVNGGRVYVGGGDPNDPKTPVAGTIYIQGLKIASKVIEEAENGPVPASKSGGKTVAKNLIRRRLPVGRYVSYRLQPGQDYILRVGGAAAVAAQDDKVEVRDATVETVFAQVA